MITFWVICGLFILIALAFVLPPFWRDVPEPAKKNAEVRDVNLSLYKDQLAELEADLRNGLITQEQFEQDRDEIERRLLEDVSLDKAKNNSTKPVAQARAHAYAIAFILPILAIGLYFKLGSPNAETARPQTTAPSSSSAAAPAEMSAAQIEANVAALAKRLDSNPSDAEGWVMLARSYSVLEKYDQSSKAYEKAAALKPADAELLADYALALAMANGRRFEGQPTNLIKRALQLEPDNPNVLALAGGAAFEHRNYKQAIEYWNRLLDHVPANSEMAQAVKEKLKEAKSLAGESAGNP